MSAFDFVRPSGVWAPEMVPGAGDYRGWDWRQTQLVNGDDGGTWNPTSPIILGGSGIQLQSPASRISGGVRTSLGGRLRLGGPADIIGLKPPRTLVRTLDFLSIPATNIQFTGQSIGSRSGGSVFNFRPEACIPTIAPIPGLPPGSVGMVPLYVNQFIDPITGLPRPLVITVPSSWILNGRFISPSGSGIAPSLTNLQLSLVTLNFRIFQTTGVMPTAAMQLAPASGVTPTLPPISAAALTIQTWIPFAIYSVGTYVKPLTTRAPITYFRCIITGGPFAVVEPIWNYTPGSVTTDGGGNAFVCIGPTGDYYAPDLATLLSNGNPQSLSAAMDPLISPNIDGASNFVQVTLRSVPPFCILHSLQFTFANMTQLLYT